MKLQAAMQIDDVCVEFESALRDGPAPRIEDFVDRLSEDLRPELLRELLLLEIAWHTARGDGADIDGYAQRFPEHRELVEAAVKETAGGAAAHHEAASAMPQLGGFDIIRELGRGGMGVVYEARQTSLNRRVALKVLSTGLGLTGKAVLRFHREAEAGGRLHHTNIVPIYSTGEENGVHYYVMEFIDGPSLDRVLADMRTAADDSPGSPGLAETFILAAADATGGEAIQSGSGDSSLGESASLRGRHDYFDQVARMIAEIADGLEHAHEHGVVHRDIKPANLLVGPDAHLSIADFGLARMFEQPGMTVSGELLGSPLYMSPEQIAVGRMALDHRTDIYSLGATLYELLTLHPPHPGQQRDQVISQILTKEPVAPRSRDRRIPQDLETICLKAIEKDPDRRYQRAIQMADDLRSYVNRNAISARRISLPGRVARWAQRHRALAAALSCSTVLALAVVFIVWWSATTRDRLVSQTRQVELKREQADAIEAAFRGDLEAALRHAENAEQRGADRVWAHMVRGIVSLYEDQGSSSRAVIELEAAVRASPDHLACRALLATAYVWAGRWADYEATMARLQGVKDPENLIDAFFLGQAKMWTDATNAVRLLKKVRHSPAWASSGVVRTVYAESLGHAGWQTDRLELAEQSVEEARTACVILENNPLPVAIANWAHLVAATLRRSHGESDADLLEATEANVRKLEHHPDYDIGYPCRAWYFDAIGDTDAAIELWRQAVVRTEGVGWMGAAYAAEMFRAERSAEALTLLQQVATQAQDAHVCMARAALIRDARGDAGRDEIAAISSRLETEAADDPAGHALLMRAAIVCRLQMSDIEGARRLCRRLKRKDAKKLTSLDVILGTATAEQVVGQLDGPRVTQGLERHDIALFLLASSDPEDRRRAREVLLPAVLIGGLMVDPQTHWFRAIYERNFGPVDSPE